MKTLALLLILAPLASASVLNLHSLPGAPNVAYLDTTTYPWDAPDDTVTQVWRLVADVYAPFNVDVTTQDPGTRPNVAWVVIGGASQGGVVGQSVIGNWKIGTQFRGGLLTYYGSVYPDGLSIIDTADAIAHEQGHLFGLQHSTDDIMYPTIRGYIPSPAWDAANYDALGHTLGFVSAPPVPEPSTIGVLAFFLIIFLSRRQRSVRPAWSGTSFASMSVSRSSKLN